MIIIATDDQIWRPGCYGANGFETPNIDKMAKDGIRFTDFLRISGNMRASRASSMTGAIQVELVFTAKSLECKST